MCSWGTPPSSKKIMMSGNDVLSRKKIKAIVDHGTDGKDALISKQSGKFSRKK